MTRYNVRHKFSSPWRVRQTMQSLGIGDYLLNNLRTFKDNMSKALASIYDKYTVQEWAEQHLDPLVDQITDLIERARVLSENQVWPRRPLNPVKAVASAAAKSPNMATLSPVDRGDSSRHA